MFVCRPLFYSKERLGYFKNNRAFVFQKEKEAKPMNTQKFFL
ncbi:MAG: hypothetical protein HPY66_0599 [Firmicutes bacterium]|nr:hypothetical protein [Bacillota bacterium]